MAGAAQCEDTMNELTRRRILAGGISALAARPTRAEQGWPDRSITMVHGFPPGGTVDLVTRIVADGLAKRLRQPVIVEGRPGASGITATGQVARAAPNGYTLLVIPSGHAVIAATFKSLPYRAVDDFTAIAMAVEYPYVLVTYSDSPARTVRDLIELARSRDTPLLYGTPGIASGPHLAIELLAKTAKIRVQHVPYRGSAPAAVDLIGKRLDLMADPPGALLEHVRSGGLRALAVTGGARFPSLPDVPTMSESGILDYVVTAWQAIIAPAGLPGAIVDRLNAEVASVLQDPASVERLRAIGAEPKLSSAEQLRARMIADIAKWTAVADSMGFERI
jgi:tripartite-type tricarboxylate transporter receptor subunit TctC